MRCKSLTRGRDRRQLATFTETTKLTELRQVNRSKNLSSQKFPNIGEKQHNTEANCNSTSTSAIASNNSDNSNNNNEQHSDDTQWGTFSNIIQVLKGL